MLSIVAIVVAPYLKTKTPPTSEILKFVVCNSVAAPDVLPVPPLAIGRVPVTWEVKLTPDSVPPKVKLPELVTVPVNVIPLTVPVPLTDVTVPVPGAEAEIV